MIPRPPRSTLSLHDALPICRNVPRDDLNVPLLLDLPHSFQHVLAMAVRGIDNDDIDIRLDQCLDARSEEHTSELQSQFHLVCRLLLEKKKKPNTNRPGSALK